MEGMLEEEEEDEEEMEMEAGLKKAANQIKFGNRRPVTQLMCNYCNYTSSKRLVLLTCLFTSHLYKVICC